MQKKSTLIIILNVDGYGKQTFSIHLILDAKRNNFQAYLPLFGPASGVVPLTVVSSGSEATWRLSVPRLVTPAKNMIKF